jgi:hypothetical protein
MTAILVRAWLGSPGLSMIPEKFLTRAIVPVGPGCNTFDK